MNLPEKTARPGRPRRQKGRRPPKEIPPDAVPATPPWGRGDAAVLVTLALTACIVAWPILRGGYLTYIDNAVHLAEIWELSRPDSPLWSEIGFAGFPLGTLHSPLWYPALAWLVRHGAALEPLYRALLLLSFLAPSAALYAVLRKRTSRVFAATLAFLLLIQPPAIWGIGSPLGGMWTHALSTAVFILLTDLLARPSWSAWEHWKAAALLGFAVLTHLFVLPLMAIAFVASSAVHALRGLFTWEETRRRLASSAVAAAVSAKYWLTLLMVGNESKAPHQALRPLEIAYRLFLPTDAMYLIDGRPAESLRWDLHMTDAAVMILLLALGVVGFFRGRKRADALPAVSFLFASLLLSLLVLHRYLALSFLGPVSFRLIEGVRVGLALSAVYALGDRLDARLRVLPRWATAALPAVAIGSGFWWGRPLANDRPDLPARELDGVRELASWLVSNATPDWGRIYVQDTFGFEWRTGGVRQSHLPVLLRHYTNLPQLGTYYGVVPIQLRWTLSEFNSLFGMWNPTEEWLLEASEKTNAGVIVTSNSWMMEHVGGMSHFQDLATIGRYTVYRNKGAIHRPIAELSPANHVGVVEWATDEFRFPLSTEYSRSRVLAKTSWHPWWHLDGIPGAYLRESPEGFLVLDEIPKGDFRVRLWYEPDETPLRVTLFGAAALLAWGAALALRARKRREVVPA